MQFLNNLRLFLMLGLLFLLSGCKTISSDEIKSCQNQCLAQYDHCLKICDNSCPGCCSQNRISATVAYKRYANECLVLGKPVIHLLQYYHDPLKCNKTTCSCQDDLLLCKQHCVGKIHKRLKTFKNC